MAPWGRGKALIATLVSLTLTCLGFAGAIYIENPKMADLAANFVGAGIFGTLLFLTDLIYEIFHRKRR